MSRAWFLFGATLIGSTLCWWPLSIWQNLHLNLGFPLGFIAILAGLSTALSGGRWQRFVAASSVGAFFGVIIGGILWPDEDGIAQSYLLFGAVIAAAGSAIVSLIAGLAMRFLVNRNPR